MKYAIEAVLHASFDSTVKHVVDMLAKEGFGVVSVIEMDKKFKEKLGVEAARYTILGACSPSHAYKAVQKEELVGLMLPCNVVVIEKDSVHTKVAAIDPVVSMMAIENHELKPLALEIREKLMRVIETL